MYSLRRSLRPTRNPLRLPTGSRRHLSTNSNSTPAQPKEDPDADEVDEFDPDEPEEEEPETPKLGGLVMAGIGAAAYNTLTYFVTTKAQEERKARADLLNAYPDGEWLEAIRQANDKETNEAGRQTQGETAADRSMLTETLTTTSRGEVVDFVESLTRRERAMLGAAITGQVETAHLGLNRKMRTQEERESIPLGIRFDEEDRQFYWGGNRNEGAVSYVCVVM